MEKTKVVQYLESSFLKPLLEIEEVTDISYNGESLYYVTNTFGRRKSDIHISSDTVKDFIRQLSNLAEKQFSFQEPILDIFAGKYRLNAVHQSIARKEDEPAITFSLRINLGTNKIEHDSTFMNEETRSLLEVLIKSNMSIVIGGATSSGKTELQKYLLTLLKKDTRVIIIDSVMELDCIRKNADIDVTSWQADEANRNASISILVKAALRNNPDWLIVSESRGKEMMDVMNSVMTGTPIITTIHSYDATSMPRRILRMIKMNEDVGEDRDIRNDINYHIKFYIYLKKHEDSDGKISRYIDEVCFINSSGKILTLIKKEKSNVIINKLPNDIISSLTYENGSLFEKTFKENEDE